MKPDHQSMPQEVEAKLAVAASDPRAVIEQLLAWPTLGVYTLGPVEDQAIRDMYFDTPHAGARAIGAAFRFRRLNDALLITLKGRRRSIDVQAGATRSEMELSASPEHLARLFRLAADAAPHPADPFPAPEAVAAAWSHDPLIVLKRLGLVVIQDRTTLRRRRFAFDPAGSDRDPIAEIDADEVIHTIPGSNPTDAVRLFEIEIESKGDATIDTLRELVKQITARLGPAVRPWPHSKLATGRAIDRLARTNDLASLMSGHHIITQERLDALDRFIAGAPGK